MNQFLLCLFILLGGEGVLLASDSSEQFLNAYQASQQGEKLERYGFAKEALEEYWKADNLLLEIRKIPPGRRQ